MVLGAQMPPSMLATMADTLSSGDLHVVYNQKAGMGHNGGPPLDDESSNGNNGDPNGKPPLVPPPVTGGNGETKGPVYKTNKEAKAGAWKMAASVKGLESKENRIGTFDTNFERIGD